MKLIQDSDLIELVGQARDSERQRKNLNIHERLDDPVQRLCNAFEPQTYVRPHRHPRENGWELFAAISGSACAVIFDDDGVVLEKVEIGTPGASRIIEIPSRTWHTLFSLASGTVLFEVKQGPYEPLSDKDFAKWAPPENSREAASLLDWLRQASVGERAPVLVL